MGKSKGVLIVFVQLHMIALFCFLGLNGCGMTIYEPLSYGVTNILYRGSESYYQLSFDVQDANGLSSVKIGLVEDKGRKMRALGCVDRVRSVSVIQNAYTDKGFLLGCQHGSEAADVGCNMVYYVGNVNGAIRLRSLREIFSSYDWGTCNGVRGDMWGAYYVQDGESDMTVMVKVGYGIGTNQLYTIGLRAFDGTLTRKRQEWPGAMISKSVSNYEREVKCRQTSNTTEL